MSWFPGIATHGRAERAQEGGRGLVLLRASPVRQVAACDDELGRRALDQRRETALDLRGLAGPDVQVRDMEEARWENRSTGYTHADG